MSVFARSLTFSLIVCAVAAAQEVSPLEDNSFLLEEAFNQEARVVQHIFSSTYFTDPVRTLGFSFTQEWPVGSQTHQLSFTLPAQFVNDGGKTGINDLALNYRYQALAEEGISYIAPRFSVLLPTSVERSAGDKGVGFQFGLPYSHYLSDRWIVHVNGSATLTPRTGDERLFGGKLFSAGVGASGIWLTTPRLNFFLEVLQDFLEEENATGGTDRTSQTTLNPGVRYGIDVGTLQIVPGISFPIITASGSSRVGMMFYLSFEHPY